MQEQVQGIVTNVGIEDKFNERTEFHASQVDRIGCSGSEPRDTGKFNHPIPVENIRLSRCFPGRPLVYFKMSQRVFDTRAKASGLSVNMWRDAPRCIRGPHRSPPTFRSNDFRDDLARDSQKINAAPGAARQHCAPSEV
jgi:hypothetical protein